MTTRRSTLVLVFLVALLLSACGSSSHSTSPPTPSTTTASTTVPESSTTNAPTTTTTRASQPSGCVPSGNPGESTAQLGAWIQMVSSTTGYSVINHTVVGTVDGLHWKRLYTAPETLSFVDAVDANHIWALGSRSLFTSVDAGRNWTVSPKSAVPLSTIHFIDANQGWAVSNGTLLHTTTGGRVWQAVPSPCSAVRVCFDNARNGWLATNKTVYETSSGGTQWKSVFTVTNPIVAPDGVPTDLQCTPSNDAWVLFNANNCAAGTCPYIAYRCSATTSCTPVVEQIPTRGSDPLQGPGSTPGPFSVIDDHTAVFAGYTGALNPPVRTMLVSDDGRQRGPALVGPGSGSVEPYSMSFTTRDRGWFVARSGSDAQIFATTDGRKTWTSQYATPFP